MTQREKQEVEPPPLPAPEQEHIIIGVAHCLVSIYQLLTKMSNFKYL